MAWSETIGQLHSFCKFILVVIAEMLTTQETTQMTTQEIILDEIRRNPKVTRGELAALAGVSHNTFCRSSSAQGCSVMKIWIMGFEK